ncbi:MAG: DUF4255 domain-containing protein [Lewinellaceae bacterium]|nr:DUF4255 domain-containing protein [Lewinellaceae bacterium]
MMDQVLSVVVNDLNHILKQRIGIAEDVVELSALANPNNSGATQGTNKIRCSLINVEQEQINLNASAGRPVKNNPPTILNLFVLFSVYQPADYREALKAFSSVLGYFQAKPLFSHQNTPAFPANVDKITVESINLERSEMSHIWTAIGSEHLPFILYKWRMLSTAGDLIFKEFPEIKDPTAGLAPQ